jgi:hypothetical protein
MKYIVAMISAAIFIVFLFYLSVFYNWPPALPDHYPSGLVGSNTDAHAITAGALQEAAGLLVTISLALTALFGFSIGGSFDTDDYKLYISVLTSVVFGICLTLVFVYAYGVYHAIVVQSDNNLFFAELVEHILTVETRWTFVCGVLTIAAFCWKCVRPSRMGTSP